MSWFRRFVSQFDPTRKKSFVAGVLRQIDPTNRNSLVGTVAPFAVGAIPGIGLPMAMGAGAAIRGSQAVGRGEGIGEIAGSALRGGVEAGMTRGIARAVMPGTFAPGALPPAPSMAGVEEGIRSLPLSSVAPSGMGVAAAPVSAMPAAGGGLPNIGSRLLAGGPGGGDKIPGVVKAVKQTVDGIPGGGWLAGLGRRLTSPEVLAAGLQTGASIYGAGQIGAAEDERLAMERERARTEEEEALRRLNRVPFATWKARRDAARIGGTPTA